MDSVWTRIYTDDTDRQRMIRGQPRQGLAGFCFVFFGARSQARPAVQKTQHIRLMGVFDSGLRGRQVALRAALQAAKAGEPLARLPAFIRVLKIRYRIYEQRYLGPAQK